MSEQAARGTGGERQGARAGRDLWRAIGAATLRAMPGGPLSSTALRARLLALAVGLLLLLALPACTGPGLEPPEDAARGGNDFGSGGTGASPGGGAGGGGGGGGAVGTGGSGGTGEFGNSGAGGTGGSMAEPVDAGVDGGDGGLDEDGGALH